VIDVVHTSAGDFEVGWGASGDGSIWLEVDPDAGYADNPEIEEMRSPEDVTALFQRLGVPRHEAEAIATTLWASRPEPRFWG
jgi:hypothetical protein